MVDLRTKASRKKPLIKVMNESGGIYVTSYRAIQAVLFPPPALFDFFREEVYGTHQLRHIAHLVVVPAHCAHDLRIAYRLHFCLRAVEKAAVGDAHDIAAHDLV